VEYFDALLFPLLRIRVRIPVPLPVIVGFGAFIGLWLVGMVVEEVVKMNAERHTDWHESISGSFMLVGIVTGILLGFGIV
jgi:hypothetical protein